MPQFGKWVLTLGLMAATPTLAAAANPFAKLLKRGSKPAATRSNQQVAENVAKALRAARLNRYEMDVEFDQGVCKLIGKIGTAAQKAQATKIVSRIRGVKRVDNQLQVLPATRRPTARLNRVTTGDSRGIRQADYSAGRNSRSRIQLTKSSQGKPKPPTNQQMAERIAKSLQAAGLTGYDMEIRYQNGVALLGGSVSSAEQRARAGQIVKRVSGVKAVNNTLKVQQARRPAGRRPMPRQPMLRHPIQRAALYQPAPAAPQAYSQGGPGARHTVYNTANLPEYAWPAYAHYPNSGQLTYPKQYSASAWPYIGPFYPYPQVPMGWRKATLEWDDGYWALSFRSRTDRWWWFLDPANW
ncbi:MAG: BON domain-containing protein [Planctomycetaceae bacterium]